MRDSRRATMLFGAAVAALAIGRLTARRGKLDLRGKTVVITGGARGLGLELAREFAKRGARLVLVARDAVTLESAKSELESEGHEVLTVPCDVRDRAQVDAMIAKARERFGGIDVLVNDAGTIDVGPLETMTVDEYRASIDVHFWGPLSTSLAVLPEMRARGSGRIVNVSSIGGLIPVPHLAPYCAGKFALVGLSETMGAELAKDGVYVTTVCPGLMRTGSPRNARFKGQAAKEYAWFRAGDDLPLTSMRATRAARRIVDATERGEPVVVFGAQARLAALAHALFPNLFARAASVAARLLPARGGGDARAVHGYEVSTPPSWLAALGDRAAARNNELRWNPQD